MAMLPGALSEKYPPAVAELAPVRVMFPLFSTMATLPAARLLAVTESELPAPALLVKSRSPLTELPACRPVTVLPFSSTRPPTLVVVKSAPLIRPVEVSDSAPPAARVTLPPPLPTAPLMAMAPELTTEMSPPVWPMPAMVKVAAVSVRASAPPLLVALKPATLLAPFRVAPPTELVLNTPALFKAPPVWVMVPPELRLMEPALRLA